MADDNETSIPPRVARKITFNAITKSVEALDNSTAREELSQTDIINRALQLYDMVGEQAAKGQGLYFGPEDPNDAVEVKGQKVLVSLTRVRLL